MTRAGTVTVLVFGAITILGVLFAVNGNPQQLAFWPLDGVADCLQRITPLFIIALFVERAIEVFVSPWRSREEALLRAARQRTELGRLAEADDRTLTTFKADTMRITFAAGVGIGVIVSAVGVRALALFIDPDQIAALAGWQRPLFTTVDVVITGLVIGGGADGIHKIVKVFTSFFDSVTATNEAREERGRRPPASIT
jgi:hypothetical protein